jgi:drug/metabolite transporter (DMT)-like permease
MLLLLCVGCCTILGSYFINKSLQYEKASRATAYYSFELIYTFVFDVVVMKSSFSIYEITGVSLIICSNLYLALKADA